MYHHVNPHLLMGLGSMAVWERGTPGRPARHSLGRTGFILLYMALYIRRYDTPILGTNRVLDEN